MLTYEDAPKTLFSTARHEIRETDPDDTLVLDTVVRFIGQRVAAVVADTEAAAEEGCRRLKVDYDSPSGRVRSGRGDAPGAPLLQRQGAGSAHRDAGAISSAVHGDFGDVEAGFAQADAVHEGTYSYQRVQHAHLETHCAIAWIDDDGRLNVRSSTQVPFLTRRELAHSSASTRPRCASSASASAAASAASRKC